MNIILRVLLFTLALSVCQACNSGEANHSATADKMEAKAKKQKKRANGKKKNPKEQANGKKGKAKKGKAANANYWNTLRKEVNIDADKLRAVRKLNDKTNEEIRVLRGDQVESDRIINYKEEIKEIRLAEREELKKILGEDLYQKKMDFDKSWNTRNNKDNPKMGSGR